MNIEDKLKAMKELQEEYPSEASLSEIHNDLIIKYQTLENEELKAYP